MIHQRLVDYIRFFGVGVTDDVRYSFVVNSFFRYRAPFVTKLRSTRVSWVEQGLSPIAYPAVDLVDGTLYWPKTALDPYQFIHEAAHLIGGMGSPMSEDEMGPMCAFEDATLRWFDRHYPSIVSRPMWIKWRKKTGGDTEANINAAYKTHFKSLVRRGLFDQNGEPKPDSWTRHTFVNNALEEALFWTREKKFVRRNPTLKKLGISVAHD